MRKVVSPHSREVNTNNVTPHKYYGYTISDNYKGMIFFRDYEKDLVCFRVLDGFTRGNGHLSDGKFTLREACEKAIELGWNVYEFDTPQELFKWLSE